MAEVPPSVDKLKEEYLKDKARHYPFISRLEEPKDRKFNATVELKGKTYKIAFRKLLHGEVDWMMRLPFYHKLMGGDELTEKEVGLLEALKLELLERAISPESQDDWGKVASNPDVLNKIWSAVAYVSGIDGSFGKSLDEFLADDLGFAYGAIWVGLLHKTPSEVALLPESDVAFVNSWYQKFAERQKRD